MRTRLWMSEEGSSTMVQVRDDQAPMVWMHTNIGWIPIGNSPTNYEEAEQFAQKAADNYNLKEADPKTALYFAIGDDEEPPEPDLERDDNYDPDYRDDHPFFTEDEHHVK